MHKTMARLWCVLVICMPFFKSTLVDAQTFSAQPVNTTVTEGVSAAQIICAAQGLTSAEVVAFRRGPDVISDNGVLRTDVFDGLGLDSGDYRVVLGSSSGGDTKIFTLYIISPTRIDSSEFQCVICNKVNLLCDETSNFIAVSEVATLNVAYLPGVSYPQCSIQSGLDTTRVELNEVVTLSCLSEMANPPIQLSWTKDGKAAASDTVDTGGNRRQNAELTVQASDEGAVFSCQLMYTGPDILSRNCSLAPFNVVSDPVIVIDSPSPVNVGDSAVFTCTVSSSTSTIASSKWTVPDKFESRYTITGDLVLTITDVQIDDHLQTLTCSATDLDDETAMASQELLIVGMTVPPVIPPGSTTEAPQTTEASGVSGGLIVGLIAAVIVIVFLLALFAWCYQKRCHGRSAKNKQAGVPSHVQIPMNNVNQFSSKPEKTPNRSPDGKDYQDDRAMNDPDVIPREKRGDVPDGMDPRKWWRDTTDSNPYECSVDGVDNPTPTIKRMKMPFEDRSSSPYQNTQIPNGGYNVDHGYDPVEERDNRYYDDRDVSDSGYREPRYDDQGGYEHPHAMDPHYESAEFQNRGVDDRVDDNYDYDYDNDAYERSYNGLDQGKPADQYNDHYDDQYAEPRYDDQHDDRYDDRYESYGQPDGQEGHNVPPGERDNAPYPNYEQDERIPDGHSSIADPYNDPYPANYDDQYQQGYDEQPVEPYDYDHEDSRKYDYDEDLTNNQETPSYV